jgi:diaminopimelate decarboxylase
MTAAPSPLAPAWLTVPSDPATLERKLWARDVERAGDGRLAIDGVPVDELAEKFGTPLFVVSEADFRFRAARFRDAFNEAFKDLGGGVDVYYAGKSFLCSEVAHWVSEEGLNLDTCSGGELAVAMRAGLPGNRLGLHGNNKSTAEITRALDLDLGRIVVDSLQEVETVGSLAAARGVQANVLLRLTPGVHASTHEFIATAHEDQKFGLSLGADPADPQRASPAARAVEAALVHPGVRLLGVHCHIGSQIFEAEGFELAARRLLGFLAEVRDRHGVELPELDLGGGYGIAYTEADVPRDPGDIARALAGVVGSTCAELGLTVPRISIEPGRAIVGPSTFTLYTAGTTKTVNVDVAEVATVDIDAVDPGTATTVPGEPATQPRRYVSVDGGMSDNARPVLYDADYSAVLASRVSAADPVLSRVVGKHCESGDIVVRDVYLPGDTTAGDLLAVPGTGAYCWSLSSNYNYLGRPPVVAVFEGSARLIVRGETEEDLLARDVQRAPAGATPTSGA